MTNIIAAGIASVARKRCRDARKPVELNIKSNCAVDIDVNVNVKLMSLSNRRRDHEGKSRW